MFQKTSAADEDIALGDASGEVVGTMTIQIVGSTWTGSLTVKGRVSGAETPPAYTAIAYKDMADGVVKTAAISGDALIEVDCAGLDVALTHAWTSGAVDVYAVPLRG